MRRLRKPFGLLLLSLGLAACGGGSEYDPCAGKMGAAGKREIVIESGGLERSFLLNVPASAVAGSPAPLVLVFHGVGSTAGAFLAVSGFAEGAAAAGTITATGQGYGRSWNAGACCDPAVADGIDDVLFAQDMIARVAEEYCIDEERVFATGFSNGGAMAFKLACDIPGVFAATAPVGGAVATRCTPEEAKSLLIINAIQDPVVPFVLGEAAFGIFTKENACTAEREAGTPAANASCDTAPVCDGASLVEFCAIDGISHVWPGGATNPAGPYRATPEILDFFAAR
jgi:polyhydroxybutyrate depolymerase